MPENDIKSAFSFFSDLKIYKSVLSTSNNLLLTVQVAKIITAYKLLKFN